VAAGSVKVTNMVFADPVDILSRSTRHKFPNGRGSDDARFICSTVAVGLGGWGTAGHVGRRPGARRILWAYVDGNFTKSPLVCVTQNDLDVHGRSGPGQRRSELRGQPPVVLLQLQR